MGDGGPMHFGRSEQAQCQHSASAGQDLHLRQVDQRLSTSTSINPRIKPQHSASAGQDLHLRQVDQRLYSPFPSLPVKMYPQQQHQYINQPSHQTPAGVNECPIDSLSYDGQSAVQAPPPPSSSSRFPLDLEEYLDGQFRQMREASEKYYSMMNRLMELQYQASVERMKTVNQQMQLMFSLCWAARVPQPTYESSPNSKQQLGTQHQAPFPNDADSTAAVINKEQPRQPRVDQLFVPVSTLHCEEQQQQKQEIKNHIDVPAPPDGSSDEVFEHAQQNECAAEVFKSCNVGSFREAEIVSDKHPPISVKSDPMFVQYFVDRYGHRLDLARGRASVFSDVFEWMINQGRIRIKLRPSVHQCLLT
ncbi:uncharacterized protein LOC134290590 [Aedes albopictus]|uniref:Uncharacterized protein n=1 Tax=Aedes albopictus TaxID=7160 RepID=A0ABM2A1A7_AEDAL